MENRGRPKEVINFLTIKEIMDYAEHTYFDIAFEMSLEGGRENIRRKIESTLAKHHLIPETKPKQNEEKAAESETKQNEKKVSEVIAHFVVDTIICDYYKNKNLNQNRLDKIEKRFQEMDKQLNDEYEKRYIEYQNEEEIYRKNKEESERAGIPPCMYETSGINFKQQDGCQFNLPKIRRDTYTIDFENKAVDGVIPSFFNEYYVFNEEEFRKDLKQQACNVDNTQKRPFLNGYSKLKWKLEHLTGNYIFPKKAIGHYMLFKKVEEEED